MPPLPVGEKRARVFISYKRNAEPDEPLARLTYNALKEHGCQVFIDKRSLVAGDYWASTIEENIRDSDFLLAFLSADSIPSEVFQDEVEMAHRFRHERKAEAHRFRQGHQGWPIIIPIRLAYDAPFPSPLSAYLNRIHWLAWNTDDDTGAMLEDLLRAVGGERVGNSAVVTAAGAGGDGKDGDALPQPLPSAQIELEDGTMDPDSAFYATRWEDDLALQLIKQEKPKTIVIKGPRQIGKSSLLIRIKEAAQENGKLAVLIDFQVFEEDAFGDKQIFFSQFFEVLTDKLSIENKLEQQLAASVGGSFTYRCTKYMESILKGLDKPLVLAMDEVERLFSTSFQTDFFRMLRTWHNSRATDKNWKKLDMALVTSTEPNQFITTQEESPFNVGIDLEPQDFSGEIVSNLIDRHLPALTSGNSCEEMRTLKRELPQLMNLLGGQPFLVRRALFLVASGLTAGKLFDTAAVDDGPFGDHLKRHLLRLNRHRELVDGMLQVIDEKKCPDDIYYRLRSAGLVKNALGKDGKNLKDENGKNLIVPRCGIYEQFFKQHLSKERLS